MVGARENPALDADLGAALILCSDRNDRRAVFSALDQMDLSAIYTAPSLAKGISSLKEDEEIGTVIIDLRMSSRSARTFADFLSSRRGKDRLKIIGLLPEPDGDTAVGWSELPGFVDECVRTPIDLSEFQFRFLQVHSMGPHVPVPEPRAGLTGRRNYEVLFDLIRDECLLVDPQTQCIVKVNRQFELNSGFVLRDQKLETDFRATFQVRTIG